MHMYCLNMTSKSGILKKVDQNQNLKDEQENEKGYVCYIPEEYWI